uniref:NADH-ubiquinone oxidoreductase chain 2 n=1 Tax=Ophioplinthus brevirima TaxID=1795459 RepID=A0A3G2WI97_9ECHI|nr:NADH dehydrogenase subunit 2 [Ophioplinthus brevirima]AYO99660.1 NADH dehydrogenase subunit 2 [Ophioplinthus brevirima]
MSNTILYISFLLLSILGCTLSNNWLILWFWIELQSLSLIPMLSSNVSPRSIESTNKYFLFQAAGSALLLLGILIRLFVSGNILIQGNYSWIEYFIITLSFCIKIGIFPAHFWFIDVMQGINFWNGLFVAIPSKIIPIYMIIYISNSLSITLINTIGISSIIIGSIFGIHQLQLRKLIALSSIAHLGWIILIFPNINNWLGIILFIAYIIMITPLFWLGNIFNLEHLSKTNNISNNIILTNVLLISILSMAGFPPLLGFFYKWIMFHIILNNNSALIITILISASLLSLYFYIQICIGTYIMQWPLSKTIFSNSYFVLNNNIPLWTILITNTTIFYLLWIIWPLTSIWSI